MEAAHAPRRPAWRSSVAYETASRQSGGILSFCKWQERLLPILRFVMEFLFSSSTLCFYGESEERGLGAEDKGGSIGEDMQEHEKAILRRRRVLRGNRSGYLQQNDLSTGRRAQRR